MIDLKAVIKLASAPHSVPLMGCVVFDGRNAIAVGTSRDPQPWWAAVPCPQPNLTHPVAVPVATIKQHLLRSRHLVVAPDCVHNGQGLRTDWDKKVDWSDALTLLPREPKGVPAMFELDLDSLDRVLIAAGDGDPRGGGMFNGVLLDCSSGRLVATDGHRLHLFERRVPKLLPKKGQGALHVIVPKEAGRWLLYSADKVASVSVWGIGTDCPLVLLKCGDGMVFTQAIVAQYPDYMRVMPPLAQFVQQLEVDPVTLADAVRDMGKAHAIEKPKMISVGVHWGQGRVHAGPGPAFVPFTCNLRTAERPELAPDRMWGYYSPQYLEDAADCVTGAAIWGLLADAHNQPVGVFEGDFRAVVMPQRLEGVPAPSDKPPKPGKPARKAPEGAKPAPVAAGAPAPAPEPGKAARKAPERAKPAPVAAGAPAPAPEPGKPAEKAPEEAQEGPKPAPEAAPAPAPAQQAAKGPETGPAATPEPPPPAPEAGQPARPRRRSLKTEAGQ